MVTDFQLLELLVDKKVADSFQFYTSCKYKLEMAELSYNALCNLIDKYQSVETNEMQKVFEELEKTGIGSYREHDNVVDYFGIEIDTTVAIEKTFMELMGLLHNFFDTFAQWVNSSLFGENAMPIRSATLVNVIRKMASFPEFTGQFIDDLSNTTSSDEYTYISDFNNIQKHRYQLYIQNKFDLLAIEGKVSTPSFGKDGRVHIKDDALVVILRGLNYCKKLFSDSKGFVENYYQSNECSYAEHRIYNPKTYMIFRNEDDYKKMRNPKNHYHFIEIDSSNIFPEYQIMLVSNRASAEDEDDKSIELYNSTYPIIMLRDSADEKIIGILKPEDTETYSFGDEHNLVYRKYLSITSDYQFKMFRAITEDGFHYHPLLSDATLIILKEDSESEK